MTMTAGQRRTKRKARRAARNVVRNGRGASSSISTREASQVIHVRTRSLDAGTRSVETVMATETVSSVYDWQLERTIEEVLLISGAKFGRQVPLLDCHSRYSTETVLGSTRKMRIEGKRLIGRMFFARKQKAREAFELIEDGHITDVSIGYEVLDYVDIDAGESETIDGRTFTAGDQMLRVTTSFKVKELSVVPIGADTEAKVRGKAKAMKNRHRQEGKQRFKIRKRSKDIRGEIGDIITLKRSFAQKYVSEGVLKKVKDDDSHSRRSGGARNPSRRKFATVGARRGREDFSRNPDDDDDDEDDELYSRGDDDEEEREEDDDDEEREDDEEEEREEDDDDDEEREDDDDDERADDDEEDDEDDDEERSNPPPKKRKGKPTGKRHRAGRDAQRHSPRFDTGREPRRKSPEDVRAVARQAIQEERDRVRAIRRLAGTDVKPKTLEQWIERGISVSKARSLILDEVRGRRRAPAAHVRSHERDCTIASLSAAIALRGNFNGPLDINRNELPRGVVLIDERAADMAHRFRSWSAVDIMRESLRIAGQRIPHNTDEMVERAFSTGAFTSIAATSAYATLIESYQRTSDTTEPWTNVVDVANFKQNDVYRNKKAGGMKKLPRGRGTEDTTGEQDVVSYRIFRYAMSWSVDEQDIIDDDLGALMEMPIEMGEEAGSLPIDLAFAILLSNPTMSDGLALFHTSHGNLRTGSAFSETTLRTALTDMAVQQENNKNIVIRPRTILVPAALRHEARVVTASESMYPAGTTDRRVGNLNAFKDDNLQVVSDSRFDNGVVDPDSEATIAGSSSSWFVAAENSRRSIRIAYRRGTGRRPRLRAKVYDEKKYGVNFDIDLDVGGKAMDYRPFHKSTA